MTKLSIRVENTVGKGEIARYEQFLLVPQYFQKACFPGASKGVMVWEGLNHIQFRRVTMVSVRKSLIFRLQLKDKLRQKRCIEPENN